MRKILVGLGLLLAVFLSPHRVEAQAIVLPCVPSGNSCIPVSAANPLPTTGGSGGGGTVTSVSVTTANGVSGTVATATTTPAISLALGAITPTSVAIGAGSAITSSGAGGALGGNAFTSNSPLTSGTTTTTGCTDNAVLESRGSLVTCDAAILAPSGGPVTIGNGGATTRQLIFAPNAGNSAAFGAVSGGGGLALFLNTIASSRLDASMTVGNSGCFRWTSSSDPTGAFDTALCRLGAGIVEVGTSAANALGTLATASVRSTGTAPTGNTGTCNTAVTVAGGATAGTWTSTAICAIAGTIILTAMPTQTTGYACFMTDRTTAGVVIEETATTATTATFTVRALPTGAVATAANDILQYSCTGY